jgi:hypothetical protein
VDASAQFTDKPTKTTALNGTFGNPRRIFDFCAVVGVITNDKQT